MTISPAQRRRLKVRETILNAADRVFSREGGKGLSIRGLAKKIDYSPAAIYKYFGSRDELIIALQEAFFARLLETVKSQPEDGEPFSEFVRKCVGGYVRAAMEKPHHYAAAFDKQVETEGLCVTDPEFTDSKKGQAFMVLHGIIVGGVEHGTFRKNLDTMHAAKSVWASMHGLAMMLAYMPSFPAFSDRDNMMSTDEFISYHADMIIRGLEMSE